MSIQQATAWILLFFQFPLAFVWLRRAWRIAVLKDYSEVALKGGESPPRPQRFAPVALLINAAAGMVAVGVIVSVLAIGVPFERWTAVAGSTLWMKLVADFILSRHAHPPKRR